MSQSTVTEKRTVITSSSSSGGGGGFDSLEDLPYKPNMGSRNVMGRSSVPLRHSTGGGGSSIVRTVEYGYGSSMGHGGYANVSNTGVNTVKTNREKEKKDLQDLNERFASYIEKVRFLEAQNRKLGTELDELRSKWGKETSHIKQMYEAELGEARRLIDDLSKDKASLEIKYSSIQEQNGDLQRQLDEAKKYRQADREHMNKLNQNIADLESELNMLRRSIESLETERGRDKVTMNRLQQEVDKLRIDLNNETLAHLDAENRRQTLEEEMEFMKKVHEQELKELAALAYRDTTAENREFWKSELAQCIRDIQQEYDNKVDQIRGDMEGFYNLKIQEFRTGATKQNMEVTHIREENKKVTKQMSDLRGKLADMEARNAQLEKQYQDVLRELETRDSDHMLETTQLREEIVKLRMEMESILTELQTIMDMKLSLELEIAAYRKLLEGEENRVDWLARRTLLVYKDAFPPYEKKTAEYDKPNRDKEKSTEPIKETKQEAVLSEAPPDPNDVSPDTDAASSITMSDPAISPKDEQAGDFAETRIKNDELPIDAPQTADENKEEEGRKSALPTPEEEHVLPVKTAVDMLESHLRDDTDGFATGDKEVSDKSPSVQSPHESAISPAAEAGTPKQVPSPTKESETVTDIEAPSSLKSVSPKDSPVIDQSHLSDKEPSPVSVKELEVAEDVLQPQESVPMLESSQKQDEMDVSKSETLKETEKKDTPRVEKLDINEPTQDEPSEKIIEKVDSPADISDMSAEQTKDDKAVVSSKTNELVETIEAESPNPKSPIDIPTEDASSEITKMISPEEDTTSEKTSADSPKITQPPSITPTETPQEGDIPDTKKDEKTETPEPSDSGKYETSKSEEPLDEAEFVSLKEGEPSDSAKAEQPKEDLALGSANVESPKDTDISDVTESVSVKEQDVTMKTEETENVETEDTVSKSASPIKETEVILKQGTPEKDEASDKPQTPSEEHIAKTEADQLEISKEETPLSESEEGQSGVVEAQQQGEDVSTSTAPIKEKDASDSKSKEEKLEFKETIKPDDISIKDVSPVEEKDTPEAKTKEETFEETDKEALKSVSPKEETVTPESVTKDLSPIGDKETKDVSRTKEEKSEVIQTKEMETDSLKSVSPIEEKETTEKVSKEASPIKEKDTSDFKIKDETPESIETEEKEKYTLKGASPIEEKESPEDVSKAISPIKEKETPDSKTEKDKSEVTEAEQTDKDSLKSISPIEEKATLEQISKDKSPIEEKETSDTKTKEGTSEVIEIEPTDKDSLKSISPLEEKATPETISKDISPKEETETPDLKTKEEKSEVIEAEQTDTGALKSVSPLEEKVTTENISKDISPEGEKETTGIKTKEEQSQVSEKVETDSDALKSVSPIEEKDTSEEVSKVISSKEETETDDSKIKEEKSEIIEKEQTDTDSLKGTSPIEATPDSKTKDEKSDVIETEKDQTDSDALKGVSPIEEQDSSDKVSKDISPAEEKEKVDSKTGDEKSEVIIETEQTGDSDLKSVSPIEEKVTSDKFSKDISPIEEKEASDTDTNKEKSEVKETEETEKKASKSISPVGEKESHDSISPSKNETASKTQEAADNSQSETHLSEKDTPLMKGNASEIILTAKPTSPSKELVPETEPLGTHIIKSQSPVEDVDISKSECQVDTIDKPQSPTTPVVQTDTNTKEQLPTVVDQADETADIKSPLKDSPNVESESAKTVVSNESAESSDVVLLGHAAPDTSEIVKSDKSITPVKDLTPDTESGQNNVDDKGGSTVKDEALSQQSSIDAKSTSSVIVESDVIIEKGVTTKDVKSDAVSVSQIVEETHVVTTPSDIGGDGKEYQSSTDITKDIGEGKELSKEELVESSVVSDAHLKTEDRIDMQSSSMKETEESKRTIATLSSKSIESKEVVKEVYATKEVSVESSSQLKKTPDNETSFSLDLSKSSTHVEKTEDKVLEKVVKSEIIEKTSQETCATVELSPTKELPDSLLTFNEISKSTSPSQSFTATDATEPLKDGKTTAEDASISTDAIEDDKTPEDEKVTPVSRPGNSSPAKDSVETIKVVKTTETVQTASSTSSSIVHESKTTEQFKSVAKEGVQSSTLAVSGVNGTESIEDSKPDSSSLEIDTQKSDGSVDHGKLNGNATESKVIKRDISESESVKVSEKAISESHVKVSETVVKSSVSETHASKVTDISLASTETYVNGETESSKKETDTSDDMSPDQIDTIDDKQSTSLEKMLLDAIDSNDIEAEPKNDSQVSMKMMRGEVSAKTTYQRTSTGPIAISEVSPEGKFIMLENTSSGPNRRDVNLDSWKLRRTVDGKRDYVYGFRNFTLKAGKKVKILARGSASEAGLNDLVFREEDNWGVGSQVTTALVNDKDEEKASHVQKTLYN